MGFNQKINPTLPPFNSFHNILVKRWNLHTYNVNGVYPVRLLLNWTTSTTQFFNFCHCLESREVIIASDKKLRWLDISSTSMYIVAYILIIFTNIWESRVAQR